MQWTITGRFTLDSHAIVEAETEEDAKAKFDAGDFEVEYATASLCDWERRGKPSPEDFPSCAPGS